MNLDNLINNNGVYLYKDDSFQTIYIQLHFLAERGNKEDAICDILCKYLIASNKIYNSDSAIKKKKRELYSIDIGFETSFIGSKKLFSFYADMVSPNSVEDNYSKDAFLFMKDIIFNPNFTNDNENNEVLKTIKRTYLSSLAHSFSDPEIVSSKLYNGSVYDYPDNKYRFSTDINYLSDIINSITLNDLENMYNKIISEDNFYRGLVFGNLTEEEFNSFRECISYKSKHDVLDYSYELKLNEGDIEVPKESLNESIVYVTYTFDVQDRSLHYLLSEIFNDSSGLCSQILRDKYGLVYWSYIQMNYYGKTMYFFAMIDKNNKQKLLDAIDEIINIVQDKQKLTSFLEYSKKSVKNNYYILSEDRDTIISKLDNYICGKYDKFNENEFEKNIDSYSEEDIINCVKTLKRKNVFMYRGDYCE